MSIKLEPQRYSNIFRIINEVKPASILEIGTWNGNHAVEMINTAAKYHPLNHVHYVGFDLFQSITEDQIKKENSKKVTADYNTVLNKLIKTKARVNLIWGDTKETLKNFAAYPFDFIFVDGGHSLETIDSDWINLRKFIYRKENEKQTTILFDDFYPNDKTKGCKKLIESLPIAYWQLDFLEPIDVFENNFKVQMVKVTIKKDLV